MGKEMADGFHVFPTANLLDGQVHIIIVIPFLFRFGIMKGCVMTTVRAIALVADDPGEMECLAFLVG